MHEHAADIDAILARRHANGADYWATPDGRIYVGSPFSTIHSLGLLHELEVPPEHEAAAGALQLLLAACRDDGRIRVAPRAPMYPCYTAEAARMLCRFGLHDHECVSRVVAYLIDSAHESGGWRCNFTKFGRGPETELANPGATLLVLDVLRFFDQHRSGPLVAAAVESLLDHWRVRARIGPCHYGIGARFLRLEYPFVRYNLFYYLYVLSFFPAATADSRFREALRVLEEQLDDEGQVVLQRAVYGLASLDFCAKGRPSSRAARRLRELRQNVDAG